MHFGSPHYTCSSLQGRRLFSGRWRHCLEQKRCFLQASFTSDLFFLQSRSSPQTLKRAHSQATGYTQSPRLWVFVCVFRLYPNSGGKQDHTAVLTYHKRWLCCSSVCGSSMPVGTWGLLGVGVDQRLNGRRYFRTPWLLWPQGGESVMACRFGLPCCYCCCCCLGIALRAKMLKISARIAQE